MSGLFSSLRVLLVLVVFGAVGLGVWQRLEPLRVPSPSPSQRPFDPQWVRLSPVEIAALPVAERWDMPMGGELGALTYNAQPFRITRHLGDDLNGIGGYNSDLGDPVYAAAAGRVVYTGVPGPGWGKVIIVAHRVRDPITKELQVIQSMYAHLLESKAQIDQIVARGEVIGTVGTAEGKYLAHLHFELRRGPYVNPSMGYADAPLNRISPERFILERRGAPPEALNPPPSLPDAGRP